MSTRIVLFVADNGDEEEDVLQHENQNSIQKSLAGHI